MKKMVLKYLGKQELFPHKTNPKVEDYDFEICERFIKTNWRKARKYNQRLTFHPGQYNVVGTPNEKVFQHTCEDLKNNVDVLDLMGMGKILLWLFMVVGLMEIRKKQKRWCEHFTNYQIM